MRYFLRKWGLWSLCVLCCTVLVFSLFSCTLLAESGQNLLPGLIGILTTELYDLLDRYVAQAATPPVLAGEAEVYNTLQTTRANSILELTQELEGTLSPEELARVRAIIAPHCPAPL